MKESVNQVGWPDQLATNKVKESNEFGLQVAKVIGNEWFGGGSPNDSGCTFLNRRNWIENKRLIVRGKQDPQKFKDHLARQEGDLEYLNLDWTMINLTEKFCNIVSNGIKDDYYRLDIRANDKISVRIKQDKENEHKKNMRSLPMLKKAKQLLGINLIPNGFIPEDDEELKLYMEIKDRPKIEIAEELMIDFIKKTNKWKEIERRKNKDLVEIGITASRVYTDNNDGIKIEYRDPENFGHSAVTENDFSDATYFFVVDTITLNELKRESNFDDAILRKIAKSSSNTSITNYETCDIKDLLNIKADVCRFAFKTTKTDVYKKHKHHGRTSKIVKKDENLKDPIDTNRYEKLASTKDTWFEGNHIVGTDYLYDYKECENLVRDEMNKVRPPYVVRAVDIYKNELHSFLDNIEPINNQLQYAHLKIQHLIAELKPDLIEVDLDMLAELDTKGAKQKTWESALNILGVKGVVFTKRANLGEDGIKDKPGARPNASQQGSGIGVLLNAWAHYYNIIRDITGINPARDGSLPHDALLGVNKMAELASNTATEHIVESAIAFNKDVAEVLSSRIHSIFSVKNAKKMQSIYERAVGKHNLDAIEVLKDRNLHDFGFTVEMIPSQKEMQEFREDLTISLQDGSIDVETKSEAQSIARNNIKLANQYLFYKRRKRIQERKEEDAHRQKLQTESNIASGKSAAQNQIQAYGIKQKMDLEFQSKLAQIEVIKKKAMQEVEAPVKDKEFQQEAYIEKLKAATSFNVSKYKEESKDLRLDKQSSHQSKLIDQRQKDKDPIDFENNLFDDIFNTN